MRSCASVGSRRSLRRRRSLTGCVRRRRRWPSVSCRGRGAARRRVPLRGEVEVDASEVLGDHDADTLDVGDIRGRGRVTGRVRRGSSARPDGPTARHRPADCSTVVCLRRSCRGAARARHLSSQPCPPSPLDARPRRRVGARPGLGPRDRPAAGSGTTVAPGGRAAGGHRSRRHRRRDLPGALPGRGAARSARDGRELPRRPRERSRGRDARRAGAARRPRRHPRGDTRRAGPPGGRTHPASGRHRRARGRRREPGQAHRRRSRGASSGS